MASLVCTVSSKKYQIFWYIAINFIYYDIFDILRCFVPNVYFCIYRIPPKNNNK